MSAAVAVIARELRAEGRRAANYWLRWLAAGILIGVFVTVSFGSPLGLDQLGAALFRGMRHMLLLAFWIIVPLMTADCVNREKREGTLGLLFLTPLTVRDVIFAKTTVHALRALTLFLAALPVLGLPFVLGGVEYHEAVVALAQQANAILLGMAAGIYASTKGGSTVQVMVVAELCAVLLAAITSIWMVPLSATPPGSNLGMVLRFGLCMSASAFVFWRVLTLSINRLQENWKEESAAPERPPWVEAWVENFRRSELLQLVFQWDKSRTLDRNPVAWLQEYSWTARLTKWGWFLGLLLAQPFLLSADFRQSPQVYQWLSSGLALGVAFSAAGSFRRENESGLLELLLVTPLSVRQIINGRVWGICCHYLPAIAMLLVGIRGDYLLNPKAYAHGIAALVFPNPVTFVALMLVGLFVSLGRLNFFLGALLSWFAAFLIPNAITLSLQVFAKLPMRSAMLMVSAADIGLAVFLWFQLQRNLRRRSFL